MRTLGANLQNLGAIEDWPCSRDNVCSPRFIGENVYGPLGTGRASCTTRYGVKHIYREKATGLYSENTVRVLRRP
jgi:hypothetical protein